MPGIPGKPSDEELAAALQRLGPAEPPPAGGHQTAKKAAQLLVGKNLGFAEPTSRQRLNLIVAFAKKGAVVYGRAFDLVRVSRSMNLDDEGNVAQNLDAVTLYEIKSTRKHGSDSFEGHFFSLSTAELLVAQSLKAQYRFAFVNVVTGGFLDLSLAEIFARARGIYPMWSISF